MKLFYVLRKSIQRLRITIYYWRLNREMTQFSKQIDVVNRAYDPLLELLDRNKEIREKKGENQYSEVVNELS